VEKRPLFYRRDATDTFWRAAAPTGYTGSAGIVPRQSPNSLLVSTEPILLVIWLAPAEQVVRIYSF
jgi:hypothetical protein